MSSAIIYKLSNIPGFNEFVKTGVINDQCNNYYSVQIYSTKANEHYSIVNYNKDILSSITIPIYGLLRSVIVSGYNIVCFSPPKSISGNGIVVVENIYRLMDEGMSPFDAARYGVGEVAWPIIASTATTLAAFLPLAIWPGIIGEFMKYLPMTLIIVLSSSLFIALVINPMLTSLYMRVEEAEMNVRRLFITTGILVVLGLLLLGTGWTTLGNLFILGGIIGILNRYLLTPATAWFQNKLLPALENSYERLLRFSLRGSKPWLFFYGMIGLLFASLVLLGVFPPKVEFFPQNEPQYVNVYIDMPIGTDIEETNRVTKEVEDMVMKAINQPAFLREGADGSSEQFLVNSVIAQVGEGTSDPAEGPQLGATPNKGRITVSFLKFQDRQGVRTTDVLLYLNL